MSNDPPRLRTPSPLPVPARPYHHGDLRAALLVAAEQELAERGMEGFSLRSVAKRAGVSHAAPAHHFGDVQGLLTALAAEGFREFLAAQAAREAVAEADPASQIVAAGLGYVDFAIARPALFRLLWQSERPDFSDADLGQAARAAYQHLVDQVMATGGRSTADEAAAWAISHGLADLLAAGRLKSMGSLPVAARDAMISGIIRRILPDA
ncbi:TetR/AcrR family transcriptional regulator [Tabrizicola sp.]|uniref:TetR/AcrR family transcriptional regulator n=1 Tax=Tabrizicola sp. TaxID=2005166 RepID=UPI00262FD1E8|nr:TetR/AcrR family transcriptional regulator [Tabrizicola sp.]MDM7930482.1 TetR/AcrR family transcriptional regulator [Tabrizicola sp.]